jgi:DNA-binding protein HU-beta
VYSRCQGSTEPIDKKNSYWYLFDITLHHLYIHPTLKERRLVMTKAELTDAVAGNAKISKTAAGKAIDTFIKSVTKTLKKGEKVTLVGFGTFSVSKRKARKGRNPQTGTEIKIPASRVPKFTAGKALKSAVK